MRSMRVAAGLAAAVCLCGFSAFAQDDDLEGWKKLTDQRFEAIDAGGAIEVDNPFGNVYARFGGYESKVELIATIQHFTEQGPPLSVETTRTDGKLRIAIVAPDDAVPHAFRAKRKDRVDIVVFVPLDSPIEVTTELGAVEAKGVRSDMTVKTIVGDIRLRSIKGAVNASSERGSIAVTLESGLTAKPQRFTTTTGDIELYIWEDANYVADLATSGEIATDFSMTIEHKRFEEPSKYGRAAIGKDGSALTIRSKRGRVKLALLPRDFKSDRSEEGAR